MRVHMSRSRLLLGVAFLGLSVLVVFWGQRGSLSQATANPPAPVQAAAKQEPTAPLVPGASSEYSRRVVAYIYDSVPITREELGEYLIARMEKGRLANLVNKRIIEHVCQQKGIEVTAAEVEADLAETLKGLAVNRADFVNKILKPYHKTLYEWKEDVVRPRLLLTKLCRERVQVTDEDLRNAHEAYHGEKVKCRMILWPRNEKSKVFTMYPTIRDSEEEFDRVSRQQADPKLAATGGMIDAFGRHTTGYEELEKTAFGLKVGEISQVIETAQGLVVLKCLEHIPPDGKKLEEVREGLVKDIVNRKINQQEIPKLFNELRTEAHPTLFLKEGTTEEELIREVSKELQEETPKVTPVAAPSGN